MAEQETHPSSKAISAKQILQFAALSLASAPSSYERSIIVKRDRKQQTMIINQSSDNSSGQTRSTYAVNLNTFAEF